MTVGQTIYLGPWTVDFLFCDMEYDAEMILLAMYDIDADEESIDDVLDLISSCSFNCGLTAVNSVIRKAVVVIGPSTSNAEFLNTFCHELYHLGEKLATSHGYDAEGEAPAYTAGESARQLADIVCAFACPSEY